MTATTTSGAILALVTLWLTFKLWRLWTGPKPSPLLRSVAILVLGDIGRSPRMMYHADSFAGIGFKTYLIGYEGMCTFYLGLYTSIDNIDTKPVPWQSSPPPIPLYLSRTPRSLLKLPFILLAPIKIAIQTLTVLEILLWRIPQPPEFILVQVSSPISSVCNALRCIKNPPSIPTLALVWLLSKIRGTKVIIDWHNLGYSILALKLGKTHVLVKVARW